MSRWIKFLIAIVIGLVAGLIYGWLISPVEFVNTTPELLSTDYRTDMVLMIAEINRAAQDPGGVRRTLELLFTQPPASTMADALAYARASGYAEPDISLLQELASALQTLSPGASP